MTGMEEEGAFEDNFVLNTNNDQPQRNESQEQKTDNQTNTPHGPRTKVMQLRDGKSYYTQGYNPIQYSQPHVFNIDRDEESNLNAQLRASRSASEASTTSSKTTMIERPPCPHKWPEIRNAATETMVDDKIQIEEPITNVLPPLQDYKIMLETITPYTASITVTRFVANAVNNLPHGEGNTPHDRLLVNTLINLLKQNKTDNGIKAADALRTAFQAPNPSWNSLLKTMAWSFLHGK